MNLVNAYFFRTLFIILFFLLQLCVFSKTDSTQKRIRFFVNASVIANRSYSHFENSNQRFGHSGEVVISEDGKGIMPGFSLGFNAVFGKSKKYLL